MWDLFKQLRPRFELEQELAERVRVEHELRTQQIDLERRIAELTKANAALRARGSSGACLPVIGQSSAAGMVGDVSREKDQFLNLLAHDLRNALSAISGAIQVMSLRDAPDRESRSMHEIAVRQVSHMSRMVNDLMELSRIGQVELRPVVLDLVELVRNATQDLQHTLDKQTLTLKLELPDSPVQIVGDPTRLAQVMDIFLQHASKRFPAGTTASVAVDTDPDRRMAAVMVRDAGTDKIQAIWPHPFQTSGQSGHKAEHESDGLDLGLFLMKGLIELHGGEVTTEDAHSGRRVALTVRLPLAASQVVSPANQRNEGSASQSLRILIIDDQRDASYPMRKLLELDGHRVEVAVDGPTGIRAASQIQPQVILCDIGLPGGMNGFEVAHALRTDPRISSALLVAVTGDGREEDRRQSAAAGFDLHLTKPVGQSELRNLLSTFTPSDFQANR